MEAEIIATVRVDGSGRISIPASVRKLYNIKPHDRVHWVQIGSDFFMKPARMTTPIRTEPRGASQ